MREAISDFGFRISVLALAMLALAGGAWAGPDDYLLYMRVTDVEARLSSILKDDVWTSTTYPYTDPDYRDDVTTPMLADYLTTTALAGQYLRLDGTNAGDAAAMGWDQEHTWTDLGLFPIVTRIYDSGVEVRDSTSLVLRTRINGGTSTFGYNETLGNYTGGVLAGALRAEDTLRVDSQTTPGFVKNDSSGFYTGGHGIAATDVEWDVALGRICNLFWDGARTYHATIPAALAEANADATASSPVVVLLSPGLYEESTGGEAMWVQSYVHVRGVGATPGAVLIEGHPLGFGVGAQGGEYAMMFLNGQDCSISNLTIRNQRDLADSYSPCLVVNRYWDETGGVLTSAGDVTGQRAYNLNLISDGNFGLIHFGSSTGSYDRLLADNINVTGNAFCVQFYASHTDETLMLLNSRLRATQTGTPNSDVAWVNGGGNIVMKNCVIWDNEASGTNIYVDDDLSGFELYLDGCQFVTGASRTPRGAAFSVVSGGGGTAYLNNAMATGMSKAGAGAAGLTLAGTDFSYDVNVATDLDVGGDAAVVGAITGASSDVSGASEAGSFNNAGSSFTVDASGNVSGAAGTFNPRVNTPIITSIGAGAVDVELDASEFFNVKDSLGATVFSVSEDTGAVTGGSFSGDLDAGDLTAGTVPDARFPATLPAASGANLTNLNGSNVASGTVDQARLDANVAMDNEANAFGAFNQTFDTNVLVVDAANNRVGMGTTTPGFLAGVLPNANFLTMSDTDERVVLELHRSDDALASLSALGQIAFLAGTAGNQVATILALVNGTSENSGEMRFYTANAGTNTQRWMITHQGATQWPELSATPDAPSAGAAVNTYMKADKWIIQYNHGGTVKYRYLDLTSTDATWTYTTTAP